MSVDTPAAELRPAAPSHTRDIPVPSTLSPQAQGVLGMLMDLPLTDYPDPDDLAGWRSMIAGRTFDTPEYIAGMAMACTGAVSSDVPAVVEEVPLGEATMFIATPEGLDDNDDRVYLAIHGGGFTEGGGAPLRYGTQLLAGNYGLRVWGVDYRMPPDHPFPAGLDDCVAAYRRLIETHDPRSVAVGGLSAGGNLAAATVLRARDEGLPMPASVVLFSPVADLTEAGDTYQTNRFAMVGFDTLEPIARLYADGQDLRDPYVSPLFGEFTGDWPPTILISGTRDFLLSDTVRMHRALRDTGVDAELHVFEAAPHGLFSGGAPEDRNQVAEVRAFLHRTLSR